MGKRSAIILGKGKSALRCTTDFVNSFDTVVICNYPILKGYEKNFPYRADIQYRNKSCKDFTRDEFEKLGISEIVYTGKPGGKLNGNNNHNINVEYPDWYTWCMNEYNLDPSTGVQAFLDITIRKDYDEICLVGFDMFEKGKKPYFFDSDEAPANLRYLWNDVYSNDTINEKSGHDSNISFDVIVKTISDNPNKKFTIISDYEKYKDVTLENLKLK